jgi:hypothetical protein
MKTRIFTLFLLVIIFSLALTVASCAQQLPARSLSASAALSAQISTPTPVIDEEEDKSVIGSTNNIFIMGIVIVLITSVPFVFFRKKK